MRKIGFLLMLVAILSQTVARAQSYIHDESVMNQFTVMEVGVGELKPALYYNTFHKNYQATAYANGSKLYRRDQFRQNVTKEQTSSDSVKTHLAHRAKIEDMNTISRDPNLDVAWRLEQSKVESKMSVLYDNIGKIMLVHPDPVESKSIKDDWVERYKCLQNDLMIIHKSYLTMGDRQSQYLKIYKRVLAANTELIEKLYDWNALRRAKKVMDSKTQLKRHTSNSTVAYGCLTNWTKKFGVGIGKKN